MFLTQTIRKQPFACLLFLSLHLLYNVLSYFGFFIDRLKCSRREIRSICLSVIERKVQREKVSVQVRISIKTTKYWASHQRNLFQIFTNKFQQQNDNLRRIFPDEIRSFLLFQAEKTSRDLIKHQNIKIVYHTQSKKTWKEDAGSKIG